MTLLLHYLFKPLQEVQLTISSLLKRFTFLPWLESVTKVTFTSIFHPFFPLLSTLLPLRGGKLPTKRPYCGIPRHYSLLGLPSQLGLHSLLGITKTMMSTMMTVMKVTFTSIFHPFFLTFLISLPLRGGKLQTKRPYCSIPGHYSLLGFPGQHGLHGLLGITKTMMSTMMTGLLTHAAIQYASLYSAAFCGQPY